MRFRRRLFLKCGSFGLAAAALSPRTLFGRVAAQAAPPSSSLLRAQLLSPDYPFPFDDRYFACAERVYNVRPAGVGVPGAKVSLNLVPVPGKKLDIKILTAGSLEGISDTKDVFTYYGVDNILDAELAADDIPRLFYQVLYREGSGPWQALFPKSVKLPTVSLEDGGEIKVLLIGDDHTFDDGDYVVPPELKASKLSGDYVNQILRRCRLDPDPPAWEDDDFLKNGLCLARSLRYILAHEDPDFIIHLGDTNGLGAGYKWEGLGLPTANLTDKEYSSIAYVLWLRMRKMYSAVTPHIPMFIAQGNHDGEEQWDPLRFRAREWRSRLFAMPDDRTYPEGGHPDGLYYAFSWGGDRSYRGGARFIILHTTAFTGDGYPRTPEGWTLGDSQRQWFEQTVKLGEKHWVFSCAHHALGGWPSGSSEHDKSMAYGRGPLFTREDYAPYADPESVEQVRLTEMGRENRVRAFLYGHDHIFSSKKIGRAENNADMLAVCCGSTKYMGEERWWKGPFWMRDYGSYLGPSPQFWGPPGITRLTIRRDEAVIDYLLTAISRYSNHPAEAGIGTVLSTRKLGNPPPRVRLEPAELTFQTVEGRRIPQPGVLRIKNSGGGRLRYSFRTDARWVRVFSRADESWGEWDEVRVYVRSRKLAAGDHYGKIIVTSDDAEAPRKEIAVHLAIRPSTAPSSGLSAGGKNRNVRTPRPSSSPS